MLKKGSSVIKAYERKIFDVNLQGTSGTGFNWYVSGLSENLVFIRRQVSAICPGLPGSPTMKHGFPDTIEENKANCVVKYGTPEGIATDPENCT